MEVAGLELWVAVACLAVVTIGSTLQGVIGLGAWAAATTGHGFLALMVAISVLIAVIGSVTGLTFATTDRNLVLAGAASGFTGTAAGVGGPPMGLTYQHAEPATLRATLSAFFAVGAMVSLLGLAIAGEVDRHRLGLALIVLPGVPLGLALSKPLIGRLPAERIRPLVLAVCAASALALVVDELL